MKIDIISDNSLIIPEYIIDYQNKSKKTLELAENYEKLKNLDQQKKETNVVELKNKKKFIKKPFKMSLAFKNAVIAGRQSYLSGRIEKSLMGKPSSPKKGII